MLCLLHYNLPKKNKAIIFISEATKLWILIVTGGDGRSVDGSGYSLLSHCQIFLYGIFLTLSRQI